MIDKIREKIRALIEDTPAKSDFETFTYNTGDKVFLLAESNISSIIKVEKNGAELGSGDYDYISSTNELEIITGLSSGDIVTVKYTYYKYSDTELDGFIKASLVWISVFAYSRTDFELEGETIHPTPDQKTTDLIALIASILIKPDWTTYRLPNRTVVYSRRMSKEEKIEKLISRFNSGLGVNQLITL